MEKVILDGWDKNADEKELIISVGGEGKYEDETISFQNLNISIGLRELEKAIEFLREL